MMRDWTIQDALSKREHFIALGQTEIWLLEKDENSYPWGQVTWIESGGSYRLSMPSSMRLSATIDGLTFTWSIDFESRDANGRGVSLFDRDRMREIFRKLPAGARLEMRSFLQKELMPPMAARTAEIRAALNAQVDSEDCVRGIIAWAAEADPEASL